MQHAITQRAGRREWLGLGALTVMVFVIATDMTMLFLAIPSITADLAPGSTQMLWILHLDSLLAAGLVITFARVGDRIGRRRILLLGAAGYAIASTVAAFSTSPEMLIGARGLLGVAAATVMPSTMSLLRSMFPNSRQFSFAIAVNLSAFSAGAALGPPLGGVLLDFFWWGSVFLASVPPALALLLAGPMLLPEYRDSEAQPLDFKSVGLSIVGVIALVYGLQEIAEQGPGLWYVGSVAAGLILVTVFAWRQKRLDDPLLDLSLFRSRAFTISGLALALVLIIAAADLFLVQHLQAVLGLTPREAGLLLVIPAVTGIIGTMLAPVLTRRMRPAYAMSSGLIVAAVGAGIIAAYAETGGAAVLIAGSAIMGFGVGPVMTLGSELIVSSAPLERAGSASAVQDVVSGMGYALGLSFLGSFGMLVYRRSLDSSLPAGVPGEASEAAQDSVGGAVAVAEGLSGATANEMLQAVRESFALGLQSVFIVAVVILLAVAVLLVWQMRDVRAGTEETEEVAPEPVGKPEALPQTGGD